jgi:hypothetical protein
MTVESNYRNCINAAFAKAGRLLLCVACCSGLALSNPILAQATSDQPVLKPDVPKLDLTPPPPSRQLKGGVQHEVTELSVGEHNLGASTSNKKLSTGVFDFMKKKKSVKLNSQTARNAQPNTLKANAGNNTLSANAATTVPNGIGIIGVKFLLTFGRAYTMGLRSRDVIVAVDGVPTLGLSKEDVYGMIVGRPDTEVTISIRRDGNFLAKTMKRMDFNDIPDPLVRQDYLMSI